LATFAILLKAAKQYRDVFAKGWLPNVYAMPEFATFSEQEIKDFLGSNTLRQYEEKLMAEILKELKKGKLNDEVKEIIVKLFTEFYGVMYNQRSVWQSRLKNA
jgi:hypothetical protein